jgi:hypothetical protein
MKKAIDLFGGEDLAIQKMTSELSGKLAEKAVGELHQMESVYRLEKNTLVNIATGEADVQYPLFEAVAPSVGLTIWQILGTPKMDRESHQYWRAQMQSAPLEFAGGMTNIIPDDDVETYVISRAIEELNAGGIDAHVLRQ